MAVITITIDDAKVARVLDAFASELNWDPASGQTKAQFAKSQLIAYARQVTRNYETNLQIAADRVAKAADVEAISIT